MTFDLILKLITLIFQYHFFNTCSDVRVVMPENFDKRRFLGGSVLWATNALVW